MHNNSTHTYTVAFKIHSLILKKMSVAVFKSGSEHLMMLRITTSLQLAQLKHGKKEHHFHCQSLPLSISLSPPPSLPLSQVRHHNSVYSHVSSDWSSLVNGFSNDIDDPAEGLGSDWDPDRRTTVNAHLASNQTLSTIHSNSTHSIFTYTFVCTKM